MSLRVKTIFAMLARAVAVVDIIEAVVDETF